MLLCYSIIHKLSIFHCYNHIFLIFTIPYILHLPSLSIHSCSIAKNYAHKSSSTTSLASSISSFNLSPTKDCQNPSNNKSSLLFLSFHHQSLQIFPTLTFLPSFPTVLTSILYNQQDSRRGTSPRSLPLTSIQWKKFAHILPSFISARGQTNYFAQLLYYSPFLTHRSWCKLPPFDEDGYTLRNIGSKIPFDGNEIHNHQQNPTLSSW